MLEGTLTLLVENEPRELARAIRARRPGGPPPAGQPRRRAASAARAAAGAHAHESRDGRAYESWDEEGDGRPPQEVAHPDDLS